MQGRRWPAATRSCCASSTSPRDGGPSSGWRTRSSTLRASPPPYTSTLRRRAHKCSSRTRTRTTCLCGSFTAPRRGARACLGSSSRARLALTWSSATRSCACCRSSRATTWRVARRTRWRTRRNSTAVTSTWSQAMCCTCPRVLCTTQRLRTRLRRTTSPSASTASTCSGSTSSTTSSPSSPLRRLRERVARSLPPSQQAPSRLSTR
mmetsp:Transcript_58762/g.134805  ORF Transcript_58762/g.134805 Transcript_58762/m.134805 type:complete len:207 (-) Transcript_58762:1384-2004(-)